MKALQYAILVLTLALPGAITAAQRGIVDTVCTQYENPGVKCELSYNALDDWSMVSTLHTYTKTYVKRDMPAAVEELMASGAKVGSHYGYIQGTQCGVGFNLPDGVVTFVSDNWQSNILILNDGTAQEQQIRSHGGRTNSAHDYNGDGVVNNTDLQYFLNVVPSVQVQYQISCWHAVPQADEVAPEPETQTAVLSQAGWSLHGVDSEEVVATNNSAGRAFDGNANTFWHSKWRGGAPTHPHYVDINLGAEYTLSGVRYLPRQDGGINGRVKDYAVYVSADGVNWGAAVATGTFPDGAAEQEVLFAETTGQYIRFEALNEVNGGPWTSVAELTVLHEVFVLNVGGFQ